MYARDFIRRLSQEFRGAQLDSELFVVERPHGLSTGIVVVAAALTLFAGFVVDDTSAVAAWAGTGFQLAMFACLVVAMLVSEGAESTSVRADTSPVIVFGYLLAVPGDMRAVLAYAGARGVSKLLADVRLSGGVRGVVYNVAFAAFSAGLVAVETATLASVLPIAIVAVVVVIVDDVVGNACIGEFAWDPSVGSLRASQGTSIVRRPIEALGLIGFFLLGYAAFLQLEWLALLAASAPVLESISVSRKSTDLVIAEHELHHDPLTGIGNRRRIEESIDRDIDLSKTDGSDVFVLLGDLDNFKAVNDTRGHTVGDDVLVRTAAAIAAACDGVGQVTVGRLGGEEFVVCGSAVPRSVAAQLAERIRIAVAAAVGELGCTISIGVTFLEALDTISDILGRADHAMYIAKASGKNTVVVHDDLRWRVDQRMSEIIGHAFGLRIGIALGEARVLGAYALECGLEAWSLVVRSVTCELLCMSARYDEAIEEARAVLDGSANPQARARALAASASASAVTGDRRAAQEYLERLAGMDARAVPHVGVLVATCEARSRLIEGDVAAAHRILLDIDPPADPGLASLTAMVSGHVAAFGFPEAARTIVRSAGEGFDTAFGQAVLGDLREVLITVDGGDVGALAARAERWRAAGMPIEAAVVELSAHAIAVQRGTRGTGAYADAARRAFGDHSARGWLAVVERLADDDAAGEGRRAA